MGNINLVSRWYIAIGMAVLSLILEYRRILKDRKLKKEEEELLKRESDELKFVKRFARQSRTSLHQIENELQMLKEPYRVWEESTIPSDRFETFKDVPSLATKQGFMKEQIGTQKLFNEVDVSCGSVIRSSLELVDYHLAQSGKLGADDRVLFAPRLLIEQLMNELQDDVFHITSPEKKLDMVVKVDHSVPEFIFFDRQKLQKTLKYLILDQEPFLRDGDAINIEVTAQPSESFEEDGKTLDVIISVVGTRALLIGEDPIDPPVPKPHRQVITAAFIEHVKGKIDVRFEFKKDQCQEITAILRLPVEYYSYASSRLEQLEKPSVNFPSSPGLDGYIDAASQILPDPRLPRYEEEMKKYLDSLKDILIIESNDMNRTILFRQVNSILQETSCEDGTTIHVAQNGMEAMKILENISVASVPVILTGVDIDCDGMNGVELMSAIMRVYEGCKIVVYALTASSCGDEENFAKRYGFDGVSRSPFTTHDMRQILLGCAKKRVHLMKNKGKASEGEKNTERILDEAMDPRRNGGKFWVYEKRRNLHLDRVRKRLGYRDEKKLVTLKDMADGNGNVDDYFDSDMSENEDDEGKCKSRVTKEEKEERTRTFDYSLSFDILCILFYLAMHVLLMFGYDLLSVNRGVHYIFILSCVFSVVAQAERFTSFKYFTVLVCLTFAALIYSLKFENVTNEGQDIFSMVCYYALILLQVVKMKLEKGKGEEKERVMVIEKLQKINEDRAKNTANISKQITSPSSTILLTTSEIVSRVENLSLLNLKNGLDKVTMYEYVMKSHNDNDITSSSSIVQERVRRAVKRSSENLYGRLMLINSMYDKNCNERRKEKKLKKQDIQVMNEEEEEEVEGEEMFEFTNLFNHRMDEARTKLRKLYSTISESTRILDVVSLRFELSIHNFLTLCAMKNGQLKRLQERREIGKFGDCDVKLRDFLSCEMNRFRSFARLTKGRRRRDSVGTTDGKRDKNGRDDEGVSGNIEKKDCVNDEFVFDVKFENFEESERSNDLVSLEVYYVRLILENILYNCFEHLQGS